MNKVLRQKATSGSRAIATLDTRQGKQSYMDFREKQRRNNFFRKQLIKRKTKAERAFEEILIEMNIPFIFQKGFIKGDISCIVDFYLTNKLKTCVEIDGEYHLSIWQKRKDAWRDNYLTKVRHFKLLRFSNFEILTQPNKVKAVLTMVLYGH